LNIVFLLLSEQNLWGKGLFDHIYRGGIMKPKGNPIYNPTLLVRLAICAIAGVNFLITQTSARTLGIDQTPPSPYPPEIVTDWKDQDGSDYSSAIEKIKNSIPSQYADKILGSGDTGYLSACHWRRVARMSPYSDKLSSILFARHHNFGGITVGYHDNSDAGNSDQEWASKGALCVLTMKNYYSPFTELLTKTDAVVRDPCISFDGKKVLFAMSGNGKGTGYKIYEMAIADSTSIKQLTTDPEGIGVVADFEPCYLPSGDILFSSTRNFGKDAHGFCPTTNMFLMHGDGTDIHQVGFDQVNTFYPALMDDGTVLYSRWEHNDRDLTNCMGLFTMYPDGSHQTEYFGNQTGWPFTMIQARPIPNTYCSKVICIAGGHHGPYSGELMMIDRTKGTNGTPSIQMIAPKRDTKPDVTKSDMAMGNVNFIAQDPYPLDSNWFLVSWRKSENEKNYKLYFMDVNGNRELLAWAEQSVSQPVIVKPLEKKPPQIAKQANYNDSMGSFIMQDVYKGDGLNGIAKGAVKSLRVVKLHYRVSGAVAGSVMGSGPSGSFTPAITCPVSAYGASWDAKEVLGEAKIYPDGSAAFKVPAATPVYFQVIDTNGYCIATMRSWSTLMPGETFSCVGCHEKTIESKPMGTNPQSGAPAALQTPLGIENKPFNYKQMVQPIFDKSCISCHTATHASGFDLTGALVGNSSAKKSFTQSYTSLLKGIPVSASNKAITICTIFSQPQQQAPYSFGSSQSGIMKAVNGTVSAMKEVNLTQTEKNIIACWIDLAAPHWGKYTNSMSASDSAAYEKLMEKRVKWAAIEKKSLQDLAAQTSVMPNDLRRVESAAFAQQSSIRYLPLQHALVLKKSCPGQFVMVDLRGKVVCRIKLSNQITVSDVKISLPASLGTGLYLARFQGTSGILQVKLYITQ
jgi:hypothetical protein